MNCECGAPLDGNTKCMKCGKRHISAPIQSLIYEVIGQMVLEGHGVVRRGDHVVVDGMPERNVNQPERGDQN